MAQLIKTSITGSTTDTGSLIVSSSFPITLPHISSGSGEVDLGSGLADVGTGYQFFFDPGDN